MRDLKECREIINMIDPKMQELFIERMHTVKDVALYKKANDMEIFDAKRESDMLQRLSANVDEELRDYYIEFLKAMLKISKEYQKDILGR